MQHRRHNAPKSGSRGGWAGLGGILGRLGCAWGFWWASWARFDMGFSRHIFLPRIFAIFATKRSCGFSIFKLEANPIRLWILGNLPLRSTGFDAWRTGQAVSFCAPCSSFCRLYGDFPTHLCSGNCVFLLEPVFARRTTV